MASEHAINILSELVAKPLGIEDFEPVLSAAVIVAVIIYAGSRALKGMRAQVSPVVPDDRLSARNFFELVLQAVVSLADSVMGRENRKFLPFVCTLFIYLLFATLSGLIPGFSTPADNIPMNAGLAAFVFVMYHYWGVRELGAGSYIKHFGGPVLLLWPLIFCVEVVSHFVRPVTLTLRLFGNMMADHALLGVFTTLTKVGVPVFFYLMGTLVCCIQAFVFTVLTMVYIKLAVSHEESHEEAHH